MNRQCGIAYNILFCIDVLFLGVITRRNILAKLDEAILHIEILTFFGFKKTCFCSL